VHHRCRALELVPVELGSYGVEPVKILGPVKLDHVELDHELLDPVEIDPM
jgi:hypothetical protein